MSRSVRYWKIEHSGMTTKPMTIEQRFWPKVDASGDCWLWTASVGSHGYGQLNIDGTPVPAHRVVWELLVGPIPKGLTIDHLCRNKICVNPDHLEPVSPGVNSLRGYGPAAKHARKTSCPRGHRYNAENTYIAKDGGRHCRTCHREKEMVRYYAGMKKGSSRYRPDESNAVLYELAESDQMSLL